MDYPSILVPETLRPISFQQSSLRLNHSDMPSDHLPMAEIMSTLPLADKHCSLAFPTPEKGERSRIEQGEKAKQGGLGWALV